MMGCGRKDCDISQESLMTLDYDVLDNCKNWELDILFLPMWKVPADGNGGREITALVPLIWGLFFTILFNI